MHTAPQAVPAPFSDARLVSRTFRHPEPQARPGRIWPVYLTYQGCPGRCVFCAQPVQSGQGARSLDQTLADMVAGLERAEQAGRGPYELAFYGGVFTALPAPWPERFLAAAGRFRQTGLVNRVRCSTRPDACAPDRLDTLADAGLDLVEIGAQTFSDPVLAASGRGHDADDVRRAARSVRERGLGLGLQLLPGLPGHTPDDLERDVAASVELAPDLARLHPCLVLAGTVLAGLYRAGRYRPWDLATTLDALARALPVLWKAGIRVARLGLAPEPGLLASLLAGPWHPALGGRVRARATLALVSAAARELGGRPVDLTAPRRFGGELFGHARELVPAYAALGLAASAIRFEDRPDFRLRARPV